MGLFLAAAWWENDLAFLCLWAIALAIALATRRRSRRQVLGTVCVVSFLGAWYANSQQQAPGGSSIPLASDVILLTALVSGIAYLVVRYRHRRNDPNDDGSPDGDDETSR